MKVQNVRRWAPSGARGWVVAVLALVIATGIRELLHPFLGQATPGLAFCIAAALVEFYFGLAPALTVMVIGLGIADLLFVPPYFNITVFDHNDLILLLTYPAVTLLIIGLIERLRRAQYHSVLIASVARSRYEILLRADNERLLARRDADETHRLLRVLTHRHDQLVFIKAVDPTTESIATPITGSNAGPTSEPGITSVTPSTDAGPRATSVPAGAESAAGSVLTASNESAAASLAQFAAAAREGTGNIDTSAIPTTTQPGNRFEDVHSDDIERLLTMPTPGNHRVRLRTGSGGSGGSGNSGGDYRLADAVCERFATRTGLFYVLRLDS